MGSFLEHYRDWRASRLERKLERLRPAQEGVASPDALQLAAAAGHRFSSLGWDDVAQRYVMLGPDTPIYSMGWSDSDLDRLLRASAWSWASINGNAKAMSQLTPIVQERAGRKWVLAPDDHPLWAFLTDPLGTDARLPFWSWQHLLYVIALHYYAAGNAYLVPVDSLAGLSVTPLLYPHLMTVLPTDLDMYEVPRRYTYNSQRQPQRTFAPEGLVNIQAPSASSFWQGASPLRAALRSTEIDHIATERQRYNLRNRVSPGLTVSFDAPLGPTPEQRQKVKDELLTEYQAAEDDGTPWVLGSAAKVAKGFSPEELQVFDTKNSARDEIIATIGTQPSILGQLDRATYSNTKEATVLWFTGSIAPVLAIVYGHLNSQLVQRRYDESIRITFSLAGSHIGMQLMSAQLDVAEKLQKLGWSTNDINEHLEIGMPERDYLEKSTGADVIAGRAAPETDEPEGESEQDGDQAPEFAIVGDDD